MEIFEEKCDTQLSTATLLRMVEIEEVQNSEEKKALNDHRGGDGVRDDGFRAAGRKTGTTSASSAEETTKKKKSSLWRRV